MTLRHDLERRLQAMADIRGILNSMKTLALLETNRLTRYRATQARAVQGILAAAADFCAHYGLPAPAQPAPTALVLFGSERGFCGDFNDALVRELARDSPPDARLVTIGRKLGPRLRDDPRLKAELPGPTGADDVEDVLIQVMQILARLQDQQGGLTVIAIHHDADGGVRRTGLLPPFQELPAPTTAAFPVGINLDPDVLRAQLIDHYLFAVLHAIAYTSLWSENRRRTVQLDGAVHRLDEQHASLSLKRNALRQEEITEEIEVIMLSMEALGDGG